MLDPQFRIAQMVRISYIFGGREAFFTLESKSLGFHQLPNFALQLMDDLTYLGSGLKFSSDSPCTDTESVVWVSSISHGVFTSSAYYVPLR